MLRLGGSCAWHAAVAVAPDPDLHFSTIAETSAERHQRGYSSPLQHFRRSEEAVRTELTLFGERISDIVVVVGRYLQTVSVRINEIQ